MCSDKYQAIFIADIIDLFMPSQASTPPQTEADSNATRIRQNLPPHNQNLKHTCVAQDVNHKKTKRRHQHAHLWNRSGRISLLSRSFINNMSIRVSWGELMSMNFIWLFEPSIFTKNCMSTFCCIHPYTAPEHISNRTSVSCWLGKC